MYKQLMLIVVLAATVFGSRFAIADTSQFKLDQIMAKRGDAMAQFSVAIAYEDGVGTKKDLKQAFDWYSKAATQGHEGAQYKVGTFYDKGLVVKKDMKVAMDWYKKAAGSGSRPAQKRLDEIAANDRNEQQAKQRREKQQQEAAAAAAAKAAQERQAAAAAKAEQERRQAAAAREKARKDAAVKARKPASVKVAVAPPPKPKPAPKRVDMPDLMDVVVNNNWKTGTMAADYLPSTATKCAQAGNEVICFSDERARIVSGKKVTYTTKATLNNFKRDGTFRVSYVYNALKLDAASGRSVAKDAHGLRAQEGWQEPQIVVNCKTTDKINVYCSDGKARFHYVR
jgi:ParB-like chromosome segregation protein Spo0J